MEENKEVKMRKEQEGLANLINFGMHKEMAKLNKAIYDAHIEVGFSAEQAMELIKVMIARGCDS